MAFVWVKLTFEFASHATHHLTWFWIKGQFVFAFDILDLGVTKYIYRTDRKRLRVTG